MKEDRLWKAIGGVDPALLDRSNRRGGVRRGIRMGWAAAAACLLLTAASVLYFRPAPPVDPPVPPAPGEVQPPPQPLPEGPVVSLPVATEAGTAHLIQLSAGEIAPHPAADFILFINEEHYTGSWEEEAYVIRPLTPPPEGMPECSLTVTHRTDCTLEQALETEKEELSAAFANVLEENAAAADRRSLYAYESTDWDAANAAVTLVDSQRGGVYVLTARFFTEAAEGHGAWFADMAASFTVLPEGASVPAWAEQLEETVGALTAAAFSGQWTPETRALLSEDAPVNVYHRDVWGEVSISGTELTVSGGEPPSDAEASVRYRFSAEEPSGCLIIRLTCTGGQWQADFIGLER